MKTIIANMKKAVRDRETTVIGGGEFSREEIKAFVDGYECIVLALGHAIGRIELANREGDRILSAWLPGAKAAFDLSGADLDSVQDRESSAAPSGDPCCGLSALM